jgi:hypothetical protein
LWSYIGVSDILVWLVVWFGGVVWWCGLVVWFGGVVWWYFFEWGRPLFYHGGGVCFLQ